MDENAKYQFKGKFYRLSIERNSILLLIVMSVPVFLIIQSPYTVHITLGMLSVALLLLIDFTRKYRATKAWLDETAEKEYKQEKEL